MSQEIINVGTSANDGTGDSLRNAFIKTNDNFTDIYSAKEDVANKSTSTSLGTSDTLYPTQNAVKSYVDTKVGTKIGGSGTTGYISKFTASGAIGNSAIFESTGGAIGIGTTSPVVKFQVGNGTGLQQSYISGGGYDLVLGAAGGNFLGFATQTISTIFNTSSTPLGIATNGSQPLIFGTGSTERMRINSNGNVGINTTSPTSKLHVVGLPTYADNATALAGGLTVGAFYHTAGVLKVVI
jgi:hypothetical protein